MKSRALAAVFAVVLTAGTLTGCGSTKTTDTAKTEDTKKEETSSPSLKRSWFQELKAEFGKITWPTKDKLVRQSAAVIVISVILGFIIAGVDYLLQIGLTYIVG